MPLAKHPKLSRLQYLFSVTIQPVRRPIQIEFCSFQLTFDPEVGNQNENVPIVTREILCRHHVQRQSIHW